MRQIRNMHELKADRATVNIFQPLDTFVQSQRRTQTKRFRGEQLVHVRFGEPESFRLQVDHNDISQIQRIDARFQMVEKYDKPESFRQAESTASNKSPSHLPVLCRLEVSKYRHFESMQRHEGIFLGGPVCRSRSFARSNAAIREGLRTALLSIAAKALRRIPDFIVSDLSIVMESVLEVGARAK